MTDWPSLMSRWLPAWREHADAIRSLGSVLDRGGWPDQELLDEFARTKAAVDQLGREMEQLLAAGPARELERGGWVDPP